MNEIQKCRGCGIDITYDTAPKSFVDRGFKACRKCHAQQKTNRLHKLRHEVLTYLGGKCTCCGINNYDYLSIDHVNGGGIEDRHQYKKWSHYLRSILDTPKEEVNDKYQILCYNCNCAKGFHGKCPHKFNHDVPLELIITNRGIKQIHLSKNKKHERHLKIRKISRLKCKLEMIKAYGGECVNCKENHPLFLVLDHVHNNGRLDPCGVGFYQDLKKLGYPGKGIQLQLLCHNCNSKKEYIDLRKEKIINQKAISNEYSLEKYSLSKKDDEKLWNEARVIFALLEK